MIINIYGIPHKDDLDVKLFYIDDSDLDSENIDRVELINCWWWTDQLFKDNEIINAELRGSYLIYRKLTPEDSPEYCDHKQYEALKAVFNKFDFEKYDYILKCRW